MDEIHRLADRVTVLRDGRVVDTRAASDLDHVARADFSETALTAAAFAGRTAG